MFSLNLKSVGAAIYICFLNYSDFLNNAKINIFMKISAQYYKLLAIELMEKFKQQQKFHHLKNKML